ncbi:hypothetical protein ELP10_28500, partial [Klebsiella pneumoniae]|nr:hypothetical protein [Klebsiella pneumoniae]
TSYDISECLVGSEMCIRDRLDTYRFKEKGIEVVMQRAASDDNSEAIMSFIMPDVNNMTLLVKNNGYIIVKTTCWLTKTDKQ